MDNSNKQTYTDTMIAGILFFGDDAASLGMNEEEIDAAIDARVDLLSEVFGFSVAGSVVGTSTDSEISFCVWRSDFQSVTLDEWRAVSTVYRESFPTYDGHIVIIDMMHHTSSMRKAADALLAMMENGTNLDDLI